MATLYTHRDVNKRKTWALLTGFFVFIVILVYFSNQYYGDPNSTYVAIFFVSLFTFGNFWISHKLILMTNNAHEIKPENNLELYRLVENLSITAGLPVPKIYLINDASPNAFATGRNTKHAVVAVTSGLLAKLERDELEGVLAHELAHIGNRDMFLATAVSVSVGLIVLLADWLSRTLLFGEHRRDNNSERNGVLFLVLAVSTSIIVPLLAYLMQFAVSRKREFMADADGVLLTRNPEGLARALEKISADPAPLATANRATAHLFIASPFKEKQRHGFLARAFMTHPPVEERIKKLRDLA